MVRLPAKIALTSLLVCALGACDNLLQVDLPGSVTEGDLTDVRIAQTLALSVVGNTGVAWDTYILWATSHSDEWTPASGNAPTKRRAQRQIDPLFPEYVSDLFAPLHLARAEANEYFDRISSVPDAELPRKTEFLATIRAWGTWPLIAFGETFCGTPLDGGEQTLTPDELLALAETRFTEALTLADQAALPTIKNMALVGRARARLGRKKLRGRDRRRGANTAELRVQRGPGNERGPAAELAIHADQWLANGG